MPDILPKIDAPKEKWADRFFRYGLIAKGVVYCLIGLITLFAAAGLSRHEAGKTDVLKFIYEQPFGTLLLVLIALGLFGYSMLRFFQAFKDIDGEGNGTHGIFARVGYAISGFVYLALAIYASKMIWAGRQGGGDSNQFILGRILTYPWGPWIIGLAGLIIIGNGIYQIYRAISGSFMKKIRLIRSNIETTVRRAGVTGYCSRGVVLIVAGYLVVHAAYTSNAREAKGTEGAFRFIENTFGTVLMAIVALGLVGYGIFMFVKAKYQRINID
jgi:hypothetical protein